MTTINLVTRLQFGTVGFCYRRPYRRSILELWTNYGLVAIGLNILWAVRKISGKESCSLVGPFCHCISVVAPDSLLSMVTSRYSAFVVSFLACHECVCFIFIFLSLYDISLVGDPDMCALVRVKYHLSIPFSFL